MCDNALPPNDMMFMRIPTVDGYNSFFFGDYARYGLLASSGAAAPLTKHAPRFWQAPKEPGRPDLVGLLNVTHLIGCSVPPSAGYQVARDRERIYLLQNDAPLDRALWMCQARVVNSDQDAIRALMSTDQDVRSTVVIQGSDIKLGDATSCAQPARVEMMSRDRPDGSLRARVVAPADGVLFLSEPAYSERRAFVDGREVPALRANLAFTAVAVGPGDHEVEIRFVPTSLYLGAAISLVSLVIAISGMWSQRRWRPADTAAGAFRSS
jgi:hypothetical protein